MHKMKNADFEEYRKYRDDVVKGRILNPDGLKTICDANDNDPEKIGLHFLETLAKFKADGIVK